MERKPCEMCGRRSQYFGIAPGDDGVYDIVIYLCGECLSNFPLEDGDDRDLPPGAETSRRYDSVMGHGISE